MWWQFDAHVSITFWGGEGKVFFPSLLFSSVVPTPLWMGWVFLQHQERRIAQVQSNNTEKKLLDFCSEGSLQRASSSFPLPTGSASFLGVQNFSLTPQWSVSPVGSRGEELRRAEAIPLGNSFACTGFLAEKQTKKFLPDQTQLHCCNTLCAITSNLPKMHKASWLSWGWRCSYGVLRAQEHQGLRALSPSFDCRPSLLLTEINPESAVTYTMWWEAWVEGGNPAIPLRDAKPPYDCFLWCPASSVLTLITEGLCLSASKLFLPVFNSTGH